MYGMMEKNIKENGKITICMAWVYKYGMIIKCISACTNKIKNMAMEFINGMMAVNMKECGLMANNMALVSIKKSKPMQAIMASGKMVKD